MAHRRDKTSIWKRLISIIETIELVLEVLRKSLEFVDKITEKEDDEDSDG